MSEDFASGQPWRNLDILVVSPTPTHPQDYGNRKRIFEICTALKRLGANIHFVHYPGEHDWRHARPSQAEKAMQAAWATYQLVAPSRPLHSAPRGVDHEIDEWADPDLAHYIEWACRVRPYDMIIVNYTWMSYCLDAAPKTVFKVCDTHDIFGGRRKLLEDNGIAAEFFYTTADDEAKGIARADLVWAIKDSERTHFERELNVANCLTMLHSEPERGWWTRPPSTDGWLRAGVMGARNNINRRNLEQFLDASLPLIKSYMAPVKIVIAGGCAEDFRELRHANVEVVGRVRDVEDFYRAVDIVIAPMQFSTGLKIKVSEALASGAPVIAHEHAMDGYPTTERLHLLPDFREMALELVKLSFDRSALSKLAARSHTVCSDINRSVQASLEATRLKLVAKIASTICVVAPMEALNPTSLLYDHLFSSLDYFRFVAPLAIYLTGAPSKFEQNYFDQFEPRMRVFVDPVLRAALGPAAPEEWQAVDLADLLDSRGFQRAYIMADCLTALEFGTGRLRQAVVRYDAVEIAGGDVNGLVDLLRGATETYVVGSSHERLVRWQGKLGVAEVIAAPFRRTGAFVSVARRRRGGRNGRTLLILAEAGDPLLTPLLQLATNVGMETVILDPSDASTAIAVVGPSAADAAADPLAVLSNAAMVIDLTPSFSLSSILREAALRSGVACIRPVRGEAAKGMYRFASPLFPASLSRLFETVAKCGADGDAFDILRKAVSRETSARVSADAGWTVLWRLFSENMDLRRDTATQLFWAQGLPVGNRHGQ